MMSDLSAQHTTSSEEVKSRKKRTVSKLSLNKTKTFGGLTTELIKRSPLKEIKLELPDTFRVDVERNWMIVLKRNNTMKKYHSHNYYDISSDLMIESDWLESYDHFNIWDSKKVNPYDFDPTKFKDTISISFTDLSTTESWQVPVSNTKINSKFGFRRYRWHYGTDLDLEKGDSVRTVADGIVRITQYDRWGYGHYVVVRHKNGLETLYGHFSKKLARVGQIVKAGDVIGLGGSTGRSTGNHLHFEIRYQGTAINPTEIFDFENDLLLSSTFSITPQTFGYIAEVRKRVHHKIRRGDTLGRISRRYHTSINRICRLNGISRKTILRIGRVLRVR